MKCKDCSCCRKDWFPSSPEMYVCTGVKHPFVIEDINHDCTEYVKTDAGNGPQIHRCPYCNESYYQELYSTSTCVYSPVIYKDGYLVSKTPNTTRIVCSCLNCGKTFSFVKKG